MRTLPDLGALLLAAVLLMGPQVPAQASSPAPEPSASLTTAPQVQEWISRQGQDMIRQEIAQDASAGSPVNVETWSDGVLDATDLDNPTDPTTTWVAVVSTADGPVGVLVVEAGGSEPSGMVQQDAELAANLAALPDRAEGPTLSAGLTCRFRRFRVLLPPVSAKRAAGAETERGPEGLRTEWRRVDGGRGRPRGPTSR